MHRWPTLISSVVMWLALSSSARALEHPPPNTVLNPTRNDISLPVPVMKDGQVLGEITVTITPQEQVLVEPNALTGLVAKILTEETAPVPAYGTDLIIPLETVPRPEGLIYAFNREAIAIDVTVPLDKAKPKPLAFTRQRQQPAVLEPAPFSGFLNYGLTLNHDWDFADTSGFILDLEAATRLAGIVFEAEGSIGGSLSGFLCPIEASCRPQGENHFRRRGTRAVYDMKDWHTRATLGDTSYWGLPNQRSMDVAGISLKHDRETFGKIRNSTRSFNQLLMVPRAADLELIVNGIPMQRIKLQPGSYSLQDLPISIGANSIEAVVTYDNGEREVFAFNALSHTQLLEAGESVWEVTGGLPATWKDGERHYLPLFQAAANIRHGLTDTFTGYLTAETDNAVQGVGLGFHQLTPIGTFHLGGSFSNADSFGYALSASYETLPDAQHSHRTFRFTADYTSEGFRSAGDAQLLNSDILYPLHDTWLRLAANATHPLPWDWYTTVTGRYDFASPTPNLPGAISTGNDRWSVDVGLSRHLFDSTNLTLTAGYGNDRLLSFARLDPDPEFRFGIAVHARLGDISVSGRHSFGNNTSSLHAQHLVHDHARTWQTSLATDNAPERGLFTTSAASYRSQWGETRLAHTHQRPQDADERNRTQLQLNGAVAFAGSAVAIGAPVRNGFAIVHPHPSIADSTVLVGNSNYPRAEGSNWFPALVNDLPAYGHVSYPLDATDVPPGYSLGTSALTVKAPYRAGYAVELGSDRNITVFGTLNDIHGEPASLISGVAASPDHPNHTITVFTNRRGRFAGETFAPGTWTITQSSTPPAIYQFEIPQSARALHDARILHPEGAIPSVTVPPPQAWPATLITDLQ